MTACPCRGRPVTLGVVRNEYGQPIRYIKGPCPHCDPKMRRYPWPLAKVKA